MAEVAKSKKPNLKKYKRQAKEKVEAPADTIMVAGAGPPSQYISSVLDKFSGGAATVILMGRGNAIGKSRQVCEVVRRRVKGLHSIKEATSETVTDTYVAKDEKSGLEPVTWEHKVSGVKVTLSTAALDTAAKGYQKPIDDDKVIAEDVSKREERGKKTPGRGRGRGKKGKKGGRGRGSAKKDEFAWLPVRRGGKGSAGGRGGNRGLPSRGGRKGLPSRGGGGGGGGRGRAPPRSRGAGGGGMGGLARSRGAGSRPYSAGGGGGRRAAPVRSRGGGGAPRAVRSRGGGGLGGGAPRSRGGGGYAGPPRSRGAGRRYVY